MSTHGFGITATLGVFACAHLDDVPRIHADDASIKVNHDGRLLARRSCGRRRVLRRSVRVVVWQSLTTSTSTRI